ncbi:unnamed protein product [Caenorhabditis angaria]|uniref:Ubiquitin-like domain-containing protein n=1 Tax=Caenorhabditis angaria TaxID=860376 RepID=A0A9P1NBY4_9PELO|nr:unnamed protein product [Caenorhabditis angaria]
MVILSIRLVGEKQDRIFDHIEFDSEILINNLKKRIELITQIPPAMQHIELYGKRLPSTLTPLQSVANFDEIVVSHSMLINWKTFIEIINIIKTMTSSGFTSARREFAIKARKQLSPLIASNFFSIYPSLAIEEMEISNEMMFLVYNIEKYLARSALKYFQERHMDQKVEIVKKSKEFDGIHVGMFVFVDDKALYYVKTLGSFPEIGEEIDFPNSTKIDLLEIFVYFLLKLIGLGPKEVHIVPDTNKEEVVYIGTRMVDGFRTASGVSAERIFDNKKLPEEEDNVFIDSGMIQEIKVLSSILCLNDLLRNEGNYGIVSEPLLQSETTATNQLRIIDFGINYAMIFSDATISSSLDHSTLNAYFKKWDILDNIYKAKEEFLNHSILKNMKNTNGDAFDRYFQRLETSLRKLYEE